MRHIFQVLKKAPPVIPTQLVAVHHKGFRNSIDRTFFSFHFANSKLKLAVVNTLQCVVNPFTFFFPLYTTTFCLKNSMKFILESHLFPGQSYRSRQLSPQLIIPVTCWHWTAGFLKLGGTTHRTCISSPCKTTNTQQLKILILIKVLPGLFSSSSWICGSISVLTGS